LQKEKISTGVTLLNSVLQKIDEYLKTDEAKSSGFTSRPDIIYESLRIFFKNRNNKIQSQIKLVETIDNKIILNDSEVGTIIVEIDKDKKLQCYYDDIDSHDNRWIRFCLKNKDLWNFLKKRNVKLVTPRTIDKD